MFKSVTQTLNVFRFIKILKSFKCYNRKEITAPLLINPSIIGSWMFLVDSLRLIHPTYAIFANWRKCTSVNENLIGVCALTVINYSFTWIKLGNTHLIEVTTNKVT